MLKRAHKGTIHKMGPKHLQTSVNELAGRCSIRDLETIGQMESIAGGCRQGSPLPRADGERGGTRKPVIPPVINDTERLARALVRKSEREPTCRR